MKNSTRNIIGLRELREKTGHYIRQVEHGSSYTVVKRSRPIFRIAPIESDDMWETVIDFTKLRRGGIRVEELLERL